MSRNDIDYLIELPDTEINRRIRAAQERFETRSQRCLAEDRDLTEREVQLTEDDKAELRALRQVVQQREQLATRSQWLGEALDEARASYAGAETRQALGQFGELLRNRQPGRVQLETRAATTANAGARTAVAAGTGRPPHVFEMAGIPLQSANSLTVEGPYFPLFVARAATAEGATKPVMGDPMKGTLTLDAYAVTIDVSDQLARFSVGLDVIGNRLQSEVIYSVNAATVNAFETETFRGFQQPRSSTYRPRAQVGGSKTISELRKY